MIILCSYCNRQFSSQGEDICPACLLDSDEEEWEDSNVEI